MHRLSVQLLRDEAGYVISGEMILVGTICVLSLVVGLSNLGSQMSGTVCNLGDAFIRLNQPCHAQVPGSCNQNQGCNNQDDQSQSGNDFLGSAPPQAEG